MDETSSFDPQLGYMPAIPEPLYGRMKWWHFRTHFVCGKCHQGFGDRSDYTRHYVFSHIGATQE